MIPDKNEWIKALEERHGKQLQEKLSRSAVAICGLGGLGSLIAILLARVGVGKLILIDFDKVDITNLHRQQYKAFQIGMYKTEAIESNLKEIAPYIKTELHTVRMDESNYYALLKNADIICEAFDNAETKASIVNFVLTYMPGKYMIASSGMAGLDSANTIKTRKVSKHFYLCGDEKTELTDTVGLLASRVSVCASHEAHMVIRILTENFEA